LKIIFFRIPVYIHDNILTKKLISKLKQKQEIQQEMTRIIIIFLLFNSDGTKDKKPRVKSSTPIEVCLHTWFFSFFNQNTIMVYLL